MELTLKLLSTSSAGKEIKVPVNKFFIGRAEDCHLRPHSDLVSRHHCALLVEEGFCAVRDFGSRNGTYVNDERVVGQRELHNADKLKVGLLEFEVQLSSSVGGKKRSKVKDVKDAAQRTASAAASASADDDITDWLAEEGEDNRDTKRLDVRETALAPHETPAPMSASFRDTMIVEPSHDHTTTVASTDSKPSADPAAQPATVGAEAAEGTETGKKSLGGGPAGRGKFVAPAQKSSKDSREAAADALRKFFNNRR